MDGVKPFVQWKDEALEQGLLGNVSLDVPWSVVEKFSTLTRSSGSAEEREAIDTLIGHLKSWGVPHTLYEPECFISIPLKATVRSAESGGQSYRAKTPAMSVSTDGKEISANSSTSRPPRTPRAPATSSRSESISDADVARQDRHHRGAGHRRARSRTSMAAGALAGIFINPGQRIHEGICTTIWGTPDLDSLGPSAARSRSSRSTSRTAQELIALAQAGRRRSPSRPRSRLAGGTIPVAGRRDRGQRSRRTSSCCSTAISIRGTSASATTRPATRRCSRLARVFWQHRDQLRAHRCASPGGRATRTAATPARPGIADTFAHRPGAQLRRRRSTAIRPAAAGPTSSTNSTAMSRGREPFVDRRSRDVTGHHAADASARRAPATTPSTTSASPTFFMLCSTMPEELRDEKGYYAVGGCGGNIAWHTEDDTMEIADRDNLLRDMRVYAASLLRTLNAPLYPFDWTRTTAEFRATLPAYQDGDGDARSIFAMARRGARRAGGARSIGFYGAAPYAPTGDGCERFNFAQRRLARLLVPVNYSRMRAFYPRSGARRPPLPDLAPALSMRRRHDDVNARHL